MKIYGWGCVLYGVQHESPRGALCETWRNLEGRQGVHTPAFRHVLSRREKVLAAWPAS